MQCAKPSSDEYSPPEKLCKRCYGHGPTCIDSFNDASHTSHCLERGDEGPKRENASNFYIKHREEDG